MVFAALIAEAGSGLADNWIAVAALVVTGFFGWLSNRDKVRLDDKVKGLQGEVMILTERMKDCHRERDETKAELLVARAEVTSLRAEITELRRRFDSRSAEHRPLRED
jgi:hypothetical protein